MQQVRDHVDHGEVLHEGSYRFEPTATFFYEDLFAPLEQPPTLFESVLERLRWR